MSHVGYHVKVCFGRGVMIRRTWSQVHPCAPEMDMENYSMYLAKALKDIFNLILMRTSLSRSEMKKVLATMQPPNPTFPQADLILRDNKGLPLEVACYAAWLLTFSQQEILPAYFLSSNQPYDARAADVQSLSTLSTGMVSQDYPCRHAEVRDPDFVEFPQCHSRSLLHRQPLHSREVIEKLLAVDPRQRPSASIVLN